MNQILTINAFHNVLLVENGKDNTLIVTGSEDLLKVTEERIQVISVPVQQKLVTVQEVAQLITEGIQGPPGPRGLSGNEANNENSIGNINCVFTNLIAGDVMSFAGNNWTNINQSKLTDGGNF